VFPKYVENHGQQWNPRIRLALMARFNPTWQAWQTRYLDGDRYSKQFPGVDGKYYKGFLESGMICGKDGELLSRYDGIARIFEVA